VTPEAARFLGKARPCLADAVLYQPMVPRIAKDDPRIDQTVSEFPGRAYELKSLAN